MALNLVDYERKARKAVQTFWKSSETASQKKRMGGFMALVQDIVLANGLVHAEVHTSLTLPGYFRPTKSWDMVVLNKGELIAAIKLKGQVSPSSGNNFDSNERKAITNGYELNRTYARGAFGKQPRPFVGWLMLVEDTERSRTPVKDASPHFPVFSEFREASYLKRYDLLCQKLVQEQLYTTAALITSPRNAARNGKYSELSAMTSLKTFVTSFAGHIAAQASRLG